MSKVLVVYGSRHGATRGIAERIAAVLRGVGHDADAIEADKAPAPDGADGVVIGSGVYLGRWLKEPLAYLERHAEVLATRPLWVFSSGPIPGTKGVTPGADPIADALGPADGPGSGGRKQVTALVERSGARAHRVFAGAYDRDASPRTMMERVLRILPGEGVLPNGDFRDWEAIETWAHEIAMDLAPVGASA